MKKHIIFIVGLVALGAIQLHSMEQQQNILNKQQQKELRLNLAGYRSTYIYQQLLTAVGKSENKAEMRLRNNYEEFLRDYKLVHSNDPFVINAFHKLEKFKNKEVPAIFEQLNKPKTEELYRK